MSKFLPLVHYETEFENDKVEMDLAPLRRDTFLSWIPLFKESTAGIDPKELGSLSNEEALTRVDFGTMTSLLTVAEKDMPQYVSNFKGLKDANGEPIAFETVLKETYFLVHLFDIIGKLIEISQIGGTLGEDEDPVKKFAEQ